MGGQWAPSSWALIAHPSVAQIIELGEVALVTISLLPSMTSARTKLLVQILATLGVTSVACGKSVVAPDNSADAIKECPQEKGHYGEWPDGKQPDMMSGVTDVCLPKAATGPCSAYTGSCVLSRYRCGLATGGKKVLGTLPTKEPDVCCWKVAGDCAVGRPFVVDGVARLAELTTGFEWSAAIDFGSIDVHTLSDTERTALADVWARDGLTEHASVASFAQLVLELLAFGAPAELVRGAQEAMADEIRHAERAFALASRYAGTPLAPAALETRGAASAVSDLADFAARTASEACIAETIAALQLHAAADNASDPTVAALLRVTAEEESTHALLGYRIVRWAIAKGGGAVRARVAAVFAAAGSHVGFGAFAADPDLDLRAYGVLSRRDRHALAVDALESVIAPVASALRDAPHRLREPLAHLRG